jgi:hypothetical protein
VTVCSCSGTCTCSTQAIVVTIGQGGPRGTAGVQGAQGATGTGTQGAQGATGTTGAQGTAGIESATIETTDDLTEGSSNFYFRTDKVAYTHTQGAATDTWTIIQNLGFFPNLTVPDSSGTIYEGEITYTNTDSLTVTFSAAFSGKAYLS